MAAYRLTYDPRDGLIVLTALAAIPDADAVRLTTELASLVKQARRAGAVRMLSDFREAPMLSPRARDKLVETMTALRQPGDRSAVVVGTCVRKVKASQMMKDDQMGTFVSHAAAMTWLNAWVEAPDARRPATLAG